jgi:hypothetical protein
MSPAIAVILCLLVLPLDSPSNNSADKVDFKNFSYPWNSHLEFGVPSTWRWREVSYLNRSIKVQLGRHDFEGDEIPSPALTVDDVLWGDLDGDGKPEAAVTLTYFSGGTAHWDFLYVFRIENDKRKLIAFLQGGSRGSGGIQDVRIANERLIVEFADPERMSGDCCSEGFVRETYRWKESRFVRVARTKGNRPLVIHP